MNINIMGICRVYVSGNESDGYSVTFSDYQEWAIRAKVKDLF